MTNTGLVKEPLSKQKEHWENTFSSKPDMFGESPSDAALKAADAFKKEGKTKILELGGGQGRDTVFFAKSGFQIQVLDYSQSGVDAIKQKAEQIGLSQRIKTKTG